MEDNENRKDEVHSNSIRAGRRTYFFDVKKTRGSDLYLTITESKKKFNGDGDSYYEKHKIFLYKEDFDKFKEGFLDALSKIEELKESGEYGSDENSSSGGQSPISDVNFEDLD